MPDAQPNLRQTERPAAFLLPASSGLCTILLLVLLTGCQGKTAAVDNPVFAAAPPRRSLTNLAAASQEPRFDATVRDGQIQRASLDAGTESELTGTTVICEVNGSPVFLDDVLGGLRRTVAADQRITAEQQQMILRQQLRARLPMFVEQEIVLHALRQKIPQDRQDAIRATLEPEFQNVLNSIRNDRNLNTDEELEAALAKEGMTISQLREAFIRVQLVSGYLQTLAETSRTAERGEMLDYYNRHRADYTSSARVRARELAILFDSHGGRTEAEKVMTQAVMQLQSGQEFAKVAETFSDGLTSASGGDLGWIEPGTLADRELEKELFAMPVGATTSVLTRSNRFEVYHVVASEPARTTPFAEVQKEIEQKLLREKSEAAKRKVFEDLKARSTVVMMVEGIEAFPEKEPAVRPVSGPSRSQHSEIR